MSIRAWLLDYPEPTTWQVIASDSQHALQGAGAIGIRAVVFDTGTCIATPCSSQGAPHAMTRQVMWVYDFYAW